MTLTQSARLPGPSWDEEVVPALRKRLQSESRTLAGRLSAVSLSSADEPPPKQNYQLDTALNEKRNVASSISFQQLGAQKLHTTLQDRKIPKPTTPTVGSESSSKSNLQRTRTYSSPYAADSPLSNGQALPTGNARHKKNTAKSTDPPRSSISRSSDAKPTRIPKAARGGSFSNGHSPSMNGHSHNSDIVTPPSQSHPPEMPIQTVSEQRGPQKGVPAPLSTRSIVDLPSRLSRQGTTLLNESPPFTSGSISSFSQHDNDPPRPSIDSEERPYEHWYRGEVSRNGGVGEFKVGRRQEMLDIANYGHTIGKQKRPITSRVQLETIALVDLPRRKRAGSIGGMTDKEREERGSLYLDEEHASEVGQVLDESPLTDLDGEGSDIHLDGPYAYIPEVQDNPTLVLEPGTYEARSLTPTPPSMIPRPSSRQQQQSAPPTRIPTLSSSRRSSESRRSPSSPTPSPMIRGLSEPAQLPSSSKTFFPSPPTPSSQSRQQTYSSNTLPSTSAQKRAVSPASKKSRTIASKATKAKTLAARKEQDEQLNRKSVGYYPTPAGEGDDMADAIPSWTQPIHKEGNWDEVVLPVVARKKGLDGHYESADGSPQPKKVDNTVAPAPGTFGYDRSKYRPPQNDSESIPLDEFGQPSEQNGRQRQKQQQKPPNGILPTNEESHAPKSRQRMSTTPAQYPQPDMQIVAPFVDMVPQQQQALEKKGADEASGGCCQCIIM